MFECDVWRQGRHFRIGHRFGIHPEPLGQVEEAPASATVSMVESILKDKKRVIPCAVYLQGEYGYRDLFIGVPCVLGAKGMERIIEMELNADEKAMLENSTKSVRAVVDVLGFAKA